jgi:hypothetical protein
MQCQLSWRRRNEKSWSRITFFNICTLNVKRDFLLANQWNTWVIRNVKTWQISNIWEQQQITAFTKNWGQIIIFRGNARYSSTQHRISSRLLRINVKVKIIQNNNNNNNFTRCFVRVYNLVSHVEGRISSAMFENRAGENTRTLDKGADRKLDKTI